MTTPTAAHLTEDEIRILRCIQDGVPVPSSPTDARTIVARLFRLRLIEIGRAVTREAGREQHRVALTALGRAALGAGGRSPAPVAPVARPRADSARGRRDRRGRLVLMAMIVVVVAIPDAVALETLSAATAVGLIALLACVGLAAAAVLDHPPPERPQRTGTRE